MTDEIDCFLCQGKGKLPTERYFMLLNALSEIGKRQYPTPASSGT